MLCLTLFASFKNEMGDEIKVVILGDVGVGKTSLILTLVTEEFTPNPPKSLNRIGISNEVSSATEFGLTYLVDYRLKYISLIQSSSSNSM